jgi:photosystem II stability/assembly factor-like uncharacterized protein
MLRQLGLLVIIIGVLVGAGYSESGRFIIVVESNSTNLNNMVEFPGRCWAKTEEKIYLGGGARELDWLSNRAISFKQIPFDDEDFSLYLCYGDFNRINIEPNSIIDRGKNYILSTVSVENAIFSRRLYLRTMPFTERELPSSIALVYNPYIDSLTDLVEQDTIIDYLSRLSGALPVTVDGQLDTIHTRYSGTTDIALAAAYLKQTLENYGYQTSYHGYYNGSLRNVAVSGERAWSVAESGEAIRTTDGGASWIAMNTGITTAMWGVSNIGPDSVWVTGNYGVIRFSSDGGSSFVAQISGTGGYLFGSYFLNSNLGWIAADSGLIYRTTNGGASWIRTTTSTSYRLYDVYFADSLYGWAVGRNGAIIKSTNGGLTWANQTSNTTERLYGVDFTSRNNGWVVGWNGVVRHTTNGGTTWSAVNLGTAVNKMAVDFTDSLHGWIVGYSGEIFVTGNGGGSWQSINTGFSKDFFGVCFTDSLYGYGVGTGIVVKTTNGGLSWQSQCGHIETGWKNVIATKPGISNPNQQVIICGHYDSRSEISQVTAPGADDNGSGTIGVIEAARLMANHQFERTIKFCLWSGEEQGLYGSAAYAEEAYHRGDSIVGVFNFDMIAYDGNGDGSAELHCGTGVSSQALGNLFNTAVADYGIDLNPDIIGSGATGASDHASFWDYGYPAFLGIEDYSSDFNPYYHTTGDNMTHITQAFFLNFTKALVASSATFAVPIVSGADSSGAITGTVIDEFSEPVIGAIISVEGFTARDTTDGDGNYFLDNLIPADYRINCSHAGYRDTFFVGIPVIAGETTLFHIRMVHRCEYLLGDINGDGIVGGADVTFGVRYFKGTGSVPPDSCFADSLNGFLYVGGDVNGNCEFRGSDITKLVAFFKDFAELINCRFFPPSRLIKRID